MARVLIACEYSGRVREAFRARGHDAWSCDLFEPAEDGSPHHRVADALEVMHEGWDLMIAHPPCTRLTLSGVRWLHERNLWGELDRAAAFFVSLLHAPIKRKAIENPIPHRYALERIGRRYTQIVQPWQHGHGETKAHCLWLENLPLLQPSRIVDGRMPRVHHEKPGPDRWKNRSRTFQGIADAMAAQWAPLVE